MRRRCRNRRTERLARSEWDGHAIVYDPVERRNVCANWYHAEIAGPMMAWFDRLPLYERRRIANSTDGFGAEVATIRR